MVQEQGLDIGMAVVPISQAGHRLPRPVPGQARIDTATGPRAAGDLRPGDMVQTRDHGPQPLRSVQPLTGEAAPVGRHGMVRVAAGALGPGCPARDLTLSPDQRILLSGWAVDIVAAEAEGLVALRDLVGLPGVSELAQGGPGGPGLGFARPEIVMVEGLALLLGGAPDARPPRMMLTRAEAVAAVSMARVRS